MRYFPFEVSKRVVYETNPLIEVTAELRFPSIFRIQQELPADFQEQIRTDYPFNETQDEIQIEIAGQPALGALPIIKQSESSKIYVFKDVTKNWTIKFKHESILLSCLQYPDRETFLKRLEAILISFQTVYGPVLVSRYGMRYRNVISRGDMGLGEVAWPELIENGPMGILDGLGSDYEKISELKSSVVFKLDDDSEQLRLNCGFVKKAESNELGFMIDSDFTSDEASELDIEATRRRFDEYGKGAGNVFRWFTTPRLRKKLG